jgi:hypothetical protein
MIASPFPLLLCGLVRGHPLATPAPPTHTTVSEYLTGVHLTGVHLMSVCLMGVHASHGRASHGRASREAGVGWVHIEPREVV